MRFQQGRQRRRDEGALQQAGALPASLSDVKNLGSHSGGPNSCARCDKSSGKAAPGVAEQWKAAAGAAARTAARGAAWQGARTRLGVFRSRWMHRREWR